MVEREKKLIPNNTSSILPAEENTVQNIMPYLPQGITSEKGPLDGKDCSKAHSSAYDHWVEKRLLNSCVKGEEHLCT